MDLEEAIDLVRGGRGVLAEQTLSAQLVAVRAAHPAPSAHIARALHDLATVRSAVGDLAGAVAPLEEAASMCASDAPDAEKQRLTYNMNLGGLLCRLRRFDDAEKVLRAGLAGRDVLYGRDHAGYAYGLDALGAALFAQGRAGEAYSMCSEALRIFGECGNPAFVDCLVSRALPAIATGHCAFDAASSLPDPLFEQLVETALRGDADEAPVLRAQALRELAACVEERNGSDDPRLVRVWAAISESARRGGDSELRLTALRRVATAAEAGADEELEIQAKLALALAFDDLGDVPAAEAAYRDVCERARVLGDRARATKCLRNHGAFLLSHDRNQEGIARLREALAVDRSGSEERARAAVALGLHHQHEGQPERARHLLREAVEVLPAFDRDALCARTHLRAIERGDVGCGCDDMGLALADVLQDAVRDQLPEGLLASVRFGTDGNVEVHLARQPTGDEELEHLGVVVRHALAALRAGARRGG